MKRGDILNIREQLENKEKQYLSPYAVCSANTKGREHDIEKCDIRTEFQRDRDRIIHCKSFRRLKFKTQVFLSPEGDHYRTRLTHTLEVSQVARTIARSLNLNEDLTEAIALGHDLGHTPFGHIGERTLNEITPNGFRHNEQSLRIVEKIENGKGLNLTWEVRDGIVNHSGDGRPSTLEGYCVKIADRIAYLNHDIDDAIRAGILKTFEIPSKVISVLGDTHGKRIDTMIKDIVSHSTNQPVISMSDSVMEASQILRKFMFENVYKASWRASEERKCDFIIKNLYSFYANNLTQMPNEFIEIAYRDGIDRAVCDYIACMTDRYALSVFEHIYMPSSFSESKSIHEIYTMNG